MRGSTVKKQNSWFQLLCVLVAGCASSPDGEQPCPYVDPNSPDLAGVQCQYEQQQRQRAAQAPAFDAAKWGQLKMGMTGQEVLGLLGLPMRTETRGAGGQVQSTWVYLFDAGRTTKTVQFGTLGQSTMVSTITRDVIAGNFQVSSYENSVSGFSGNDIVQKQP
jgi:outer membrane protein assembly factor BamE (lipoprotein component of BamABCDE complex)